MKHLVFVIALLGLSACGTTNATDEAGKMVDDRVLLYNMKEVLWPKAYREQDTVLLDQLLSDEFEMIEADGTVSNKAAEMDWVKKNAWKVDSFRYEIERFDQWPNGTAIISGTGHMLTHSTETVYWSSNVFVKEDGTWRAVSSHVSGVKELKR